MRWFIRVGLVAAVSCLAASAVAASSAPGLKLSWSNCQGEGTGSNNRAFACDSNAGTNVLVVSFKLPNDLPQVSGNEVVLDLLSQEPAVPAWWDLKNLGACRQTSLGFNFTADPNNVVCVDWAAGQSDGGIGAYIQTDQGEIDPSLIARHRRMKLAVAVPQSALQDLVAATEYFSCNVVIDNEKSVGTGSCAGCTEPMCIVLNLFRATTPIATNDVTLGVGDSPGSNIVTWQGIGPNCLAVPTKNATWGQVKALYR